ncbi:flippase [Vibrio cyclitrophicus]
MNSQVLQKIINNSSWLMLDKLTRLLLGLTVTAWVARHLGPESYGELAYVLAIVAFCQAFAKLGLDTIVVRDVSVGNISTEILLGNTLFSRFLFGTIIYVIVAISTFFIADTNTALMFCFAGIAMIFQASETVDLWFQSQSKSKLTVRAKLISYIISALIKVGLILFNAPVFWFAFIFSIEYLITAVGLFFVYKKDPTKTRWEVDKSVLISKLKESFPYLITSVSMLIYIRIDQVLISNILSSHDLGVYSAVLPFSTLWNFIPVVLSISIAPYLSKIKKNSQVEYEKAIRLMFSTFTIFGLAISVFMYLASDFFVRIILGEQYLAGVEILQLHSFTNIFICIGVAQGLWIVNEGRGYVALIRTLLGALISLIGNYYLLPLYGVKSAAFVAVLAQSVQAVFSNLLVDRKIFILQLRCIFLVEPFEFLIKRVRSSGN